MACIPLQVRASAVIVAALLLSACRGNSGLGSASGLPIANPQPVQASIQQIRGGTDRVKIQHIIIIVQENRSFNNLFYGFPGAKTATYGYDSSNQKIALEPVDLGIKWDVEHAADGYLKACNGAGKIPGTKCRMNGFDKEIVGCGGGGQPPCPIKHPEYSYVPHSQVQPYFDMATQYVLSDEMFASNFDASSFVSHQYIISGQAESSIDYPANRWGCPGGPKDKVPLVSQERQYPDGYKVVCWDPPTLADELDHAGVSWAYYAPALSAGDGIWSAYQAIKHIYEGPDWKNDVFSPSTQFLQDVDKGKLRAVSWVVPTFANSDHPGSGSATGPSWVASLVNAVGQSKYWNSSAIFVFWDDYGGMYDSVPPAYVDYDGLGLRLPLLIISPYAKKNFVSHVHYEHGSILKFVEEQFSLAPLAPSDTRATSPRADCFDFLQRPRKFVKIGAPYEREYFMRQPIDRRPPDSD